MNPTMLKFFFLSKTVILPNTPILRISYTDTFVLSNVTVMNQNNSLHLTYKKYCIHLIRVGDCQILS